MLALDANKQPITTWYSGASKTAPFVATTPSNAYYMVLNFNADQVGTIAFYESTTVDGYIPYQGNTYTTTLGRTVYGGTLEQVGGSLTDRRGILDLGSLDWATYSSADRHIFRTAIPNDMYSPPQSDNTKVTTAICEQFYPMAYEPISASDNGAFAVGNGRIVMIDHRYSDATAFKTAMSGVQLCYELATPQTYQLDPQTISLLHGNNNVWSDGSVVMVYNADVGLYIDKKLGTSGTRTLSMTRTLETKSEETKTDDTKTDISDTKSDLELTKSDNIQLAED